MYLNSCPDDLQLFDAIFVITIQQWSKVQTRQQTKKPRTGRLRTAQVVEASCKGVFSALVSDKNHNSKSFWSMTVQQQLRSVHTLVCNTWCHTSLFFQTHVTYKTTDVRLVLMKPLKSTQKNFLMYLGATLHQWISLLQSFGILYLGPTLKFS
jgi:hypothetical protein